MWLLVGMLLFFPVSVHALPGVLLCIESDGRVEIESSRFGDCASKTYAVVQEVHATYADRSVDDTSITTCLSSCIDILLFTSPADGQAASTLSYTPQLANDLSLAATWEPVSDLRRASMTFKHLEPTSPPPSLFALRSVVLLI